MIRSLLFDTTGSLVDKLNKTYKFKIEFEYLDTTSGYVEKVLNLKPIWYSVGDGLFPDWDSTGGQIIKSNIHKFFSTVVIINNGLNITVKELLDYSLYCLGGTHHREAKSHADLALKSMENVFVNNGLIAINQLRSIGKITIKSLQQLKEHVEGNL